MRGVSQWLHNSNEFGWDRTNQYLAFLRLRRVEPSNTLYGGRRGGRNSPAGTVEEGNKNVWHQLDMIEY